MDSFRTVVKCGISPEKIDYDTSVLMLGSCFAEDLGVRLQQLKFNVVVNPFGMVYHPAAAAMQLERIIAGRPYNIRNLVQHEGLWHSFDHHGRFSHPTASACLLQINEELARAHHRLANCEWLFVTFGTAWAYRLKERRRIVANCHKFPASCFDRIFMDDKKMLNIWTGVIAHLRRLNPTVRIVFTVSPIRHLRDDPHENQLSKATLLWLVERLHRHIGNTAYFPAYEILLDELRDYRFYAADMTHPNDLAVQYILQRFCESYMSEQTRKLMKSVDDIVKAAAHRPILQGDAYRKFADICLSKIEKLTLQYPQLNFSDEIRRFQTEV